MNKLPLWFRQELPDAITLERARVLSGSKVYTVCQEAKCPNLSFCFKNSKFTFMILGNTCTRNCKFCAVGKSGNKNLKLDLDEPQRIAGVVQSLGLDYVVITSVTRDDLADGGAGFFSKTIRLIHHGNQDIKVDVLIPDFKGDISSLKCVLAASPDVVAHNIETVQRLYKDLRPLSDYKLSLNVLSNIKRFCAELTSKSSLILGLGESEAEVINTMEDLLDSGCDILTLGQYLAPSSAHYPVKEFINIEQFEKYRDIGLKLGFKSVLSGPKVRSSYQAEEVYNELICTT